MRGVLEDRGSVGTSPEFLACGYVGRCDSSVSLLGCNALSFRAALSPTGSVQALKVVRA